VRDAVLKTQAASHRNQTLYQAVRSIYARGGLAGFYQGLVPCELLVLTPVRSPLPPAS